MGEGWTQGNYPCVSDRVGALNEIRITVYNPGRYIQYVPLHFPSIWSRNGVPSASRVIFVILRIISLAQLWAFRAVMVTLDLIGVVISRHCSSTWGGGQSFSRRNNAVEEDSVIEEQPEVIGTADRLEVVRTVFLILGGPRSKHRMWVCRHGNIADHVGSNRRVTGLGKRRPYEDG